MDFDNPKVYGDTSISDGLVKMVNDENKLSHVVMYFKVKHIIGLIFDGPWGFSPACFLLLWSDMLFYYFMFQS